MIRRDRSEPGRTFRDPERAPTAVIHCCHDFAAGWAKEPPHLTRDASAVVDAGGE